MPRNYRIERNAIIQRWYGGNVQSRNPHPRRNWEEGPVTPSDCVGIPVPVNSPFRFPGHCLVWKYGLDRGGYGVLTIDGKRELAHRAVFIRTRGQIPEARQVNHLCNRPYCVQPSHLYAGSSQDNIDDSQIFNKEELIHAPWILLWPERKSTEDPLLQRLLESHRYDGSEPWEPEAQPAQKPLEEFICPDHDFAITMFGGESRICRICEVSEYEERLIDDLGTLTLIAEICPTSQTVVPVLEKIVASKYLKDSHRDSRRRAYSRSQRGYGMDSHDLRTCGCGYCTGDRKSLRAAVQPVLTKEESQFLDICDRLAPQIVAALEEATAGMMEALARTGGLDDDQTQVLIQHHGDCPHSRAELFRASRKIEGELGYLLHATTEFSATGEMVEDGQLQQIMFRWGFARMRKEDEEQVMRTILPAAYAAADGIVKAWASEAGEHLRQFSQTNQNPCRVIYRLARALTMKRALEYLRFELLGRNSFGEQEPHPHAHCLASLRETGPFRPFRSEFEVGLGYSPGHI